MKQDFLIVSCDNGHPLPLVPVAWDKRVKGKYIPNALSSRHAMMHMVVEESDILEPAPVFIARGIFVMGDIWKVQVDQDNEIERQLSIRRRRKMRRIMSQQEVTDEEQFVGYDMRLLA